MPAAPTLAISCSNPIPMQRRLLSLWLPDWPIRRLLRAGIVPPDSPVATVATLRGVRRIAAVGEAAAARGVREGQSVADASALCPGLVTRDATPEEDADALARLALWCQAFTPLTEADPPDGVVLDITGCAHLFGGEAGLIRRLETALPGARAAIAETAAAARAFARYDRAGNSLLAPLPLAALDLTPAAIAALARLGIRRIGELDALPRAERRSAIGPDVARRLDEAFGRIPERRHFLSPPPDWREVENHAEPLLAAEQLRAALARLTERLCARLEAADLGATALIARFHRVDAAIEEARLGFASPCRDVAHMLKLFREALTGIDPGFGIEAVSVAAETASLAASQTDLDANASADPSRVLDLLMNRIALHRVAPVASHIPERAARRAGLTDQPAPFLPPAHPRPVRLLPKPVPIEVIAPVPDDPPLLIRWDGRTHRIAHATGPERIARDWWRHAPDAVRHEAERVRDYYAVEDEDGLRLWVFRAGLHGGTAPPRWFLHGMF